MARLADGLGLRQELLLEDIESLSGGQRRRVDLMRVLFQEPELIILTPTNHLDRAAQALAARRVGALPRGDPGGEPRPEAPGPFDLQGPAHREPAPDRMEGQLLEVRGPARGRAVTAGAGGGAQAREISRLSTLADSMRGQAAKRAKVAKALDGGSSRSRDSGHRSTNGKRPGEFRLPEPATTGVIPLEVSKLSVATGRTKSSAT